MKLSFTTAPAAAADPHSTLAVHVTGDDFSGTFTPTRFAANRGRLVAKGILSGSLGDAAVVERITAPVTHADGDATTLHLTLGPIEATLLGTTTELEAEPLTIAGRPGLHVNLVSAAVQLFESGRGVALIPDVLNQILARS